MKDDILNAGAIYTDLPAVVDGKIITTAHYKDMGPWMKKALEVLKNNA
jgi:putative intracellular protease/amidase